MFKADDVAHLQKGLEIQSVKCYDTVRMGVVPKTEKESS